jgi:hypothetical protein
MEKGPDKVRPAIARWLRHWQQDIDLAGVREDRALNQLPAAEGREWRQFWEEVEALKQRASEG